MKQLYLILQYPYNIIEVALCHEGTVLQQESEHKHYAVQSLVPLIQKILTQHNVSLNEIACMGVNTGPGPYNTLRSLITTANTLHFTKKIQLYGFNALDLLLMQYNKQPTIALLNAYAQHLFYAFNSSTSHKQGYCSVDTIIETIKQLPEPVTLIGNGTLLYQNLLIEKVGTNIIVPSKVPLFNSMDILAQQTYEKLQNGKKDYGYLEPLYLQSPSVK